MCTLYIASNVNICSCICATVVAVSVVIAIALLIRKKIDTDNAIVEKYKRELEKKNNEIVSLKLSVKSLNKESEDKVKDGFIKYCYEIICSPDADINLKNNCWHILQKFNNSLIQEVEDKDKA